MTSDQSGPADMKILVNGELRQFPAGITIEVLIETLELQPGRLAVEVNGRIIRRANWGSSNLADGDRVEIVHFVGGGA